MVFNRLKPTVLFIAILICAFTSNAQTYAEFFRQKKTQKKYLMEQLVALKVYAGYLKKEYDIASNGLNTIKDFSNGEFGLHKTFVSSLKAVSPAIKKNNKVADIIILQVKISQSFRRVKTDDFLGEAILAYVDDVHENVMKECEKDLDELLLVITSGKVEMKDDERLKRLESVYQNMRDKSAFVQHFINQLNIIGHQKKQDEQSIHDLKKFYGTYH